MINLQYGRIPVLNSLKEYQVNEIFISNSFNDKKILEHIERLNIKVTILSKNDLDKMVKGNHQGIIAKVKPFEYTPFETLQIFLKRQQNPIVLLLDEIQDPQNFGAIIRSADAFGVSGIIIKKRNQVLVTPTVIKAATGAQNYVKICQVPNLRDAIDKLKKIGFWIVATDASAEQSANQLDYNFPVGLIIGSEGFGISSLLLKNADYIVKIPMSGNVNSLNASVATGILLYEIRTKQIK